MDFLEIFIYIGYRYKYPVFTLISNSFYVTLILTMIGHYIIQTKKWSRNIDKNRTTNKIKFFYENIE